ncbi:uncharacterized protein BCR38DRAFT_330326, partial [Pseudomassariella vexata]
STSAAPVPTATCSAGPTVEYTVVSGDTLTKISQYYSSGICDIASLNSLANPGFINVGDVLQVPTLVCSPDNTSCLADDTADAICVTDGEATYTVVAGDTFFLIAQSLGITTDALLAANDGVDPLLLQVDQVLNVPVC